MMRLMMHMMLLDYGSQYETRCTGVVMINNVTITLGTPIYECRVIGPSPPIKSALDFASNGFENVVPGSCKVFNFPMG